MLKLKPVWVALFTAKKLGVLVPPNPVCDAPDPNAMVSPDCPSVIVPVPVLFNI